MQRKKVNFNPRITQLGSKRWERVVSTYLECKEIRVFDRFSNYLKCLRNFEKQSKWTKNSNFFKGIHNSSQHFETFFLCMCFTHSSLKLECSLASWTSATPYSGRNKELVNNFSNNSSLFQHKSKTVLKLIFGLHGLHSDIFWTFEFWNSTLLGNQLFLTGNCK